MSEVSFYSFVLSEHIAAYETLLAEVSDYTAYHGTKYLLAEEKAEEASVKIFVYDDGKNIAFMPSVQRNIGRIDGLLQFDGYYDIKTPHEYSGVLSNSDDGKNIFFRALNDYCIKENIVFSFIRFNPYRNDNEIAQKHGFDVIKSDEQIYLDLTLGTDIIWKQYKSPTRRNINRGKKSGLTAETVSGNTENVRIFYDGYKAAMDRLGAKKFFYFNEEYFFSLLQDEQHKLTFVKTGDNVIAAGISLEDNEVLYTHLAWSNHVYSQMRPMDFLYWAWAQQGMAHGQKIMHMGGGSQSVKRFKSGISPARVDYYIGSKIFLPTIYEEICQAARNYYKNLDDSYKPMYRGF